MCDGVLERSASAPTYPVMCGRMRSLRQPSGVLLEIANGALRQQAAFDCTPAGGRRSGPAHRVVIQVRTDVALRLALDGVGSSIADNQIALGAFSDPDDAPLTWVQTGRFVPEQVAWFDGRAE